MAAITVLGIAQDGGRPQPGCQRPCCQDLSAADYRSPVSLGIKTENGTTILIEATRDLGRQLITFGESSIDHLFLTHESKTGAPSPSRVTAAMKAAAASPAYSQLYFPEKGISKA